MLGKKIVVLIEIFKVAVLFKDPKRPQRNPKGKKIKETQFQHIEINLFHFIETNFQTTKDSLIQTNLYYGSISICHCLSKVHIFFEEKRENC